MPSRVRVDPSLPGGWPGEVSRYVRLVWRLLCDHRVPFWLKLIPPAVLVYLFWPLDALPDLFPGLGQLDDLGLILLGLRAFVALAPEKVLREHLSELDGARRVSRSPTEAPSHGAEVIEGQYRIVNEG